MILTTRFDWIDDLGVEQSTVTAEDLDLQFLRMPKIGSFLGDRVNFKYIGIPENSYVLQEIITEKEEVKLIYVTADVYFKDKLDFKRLYAHINDIEHIKSMIRYFEDMSKENKLAESSATVLRRIIGREKL